MSERENWPKLKQKLQRQVTIQIVHSSNNSRRLLRLRGNSSNSNHNDLSNRPFLRKGAFRVREAATSRTSILR